MLARVSVHQSINTNLNARPPYAILQCIDPLEITSVRGKEGVKC